MALQTYAGLDPLYSQDLSAASRGRYFQRIIGTIMLLSEPLPVEDIACLVRLETADVLHSLLGIQSILTIPANDSRPVGLLHTSLRDFLVSEQRSGNFFINPRDRHLFVAANCLAVITTCSVNDFFDSGGLKYAALNWCYHLCCVFDEWSGNGPLNLQYYAHLVKCLIEFRSHVFDSWVNTTILFHETDAILNNLQSVLSQLNVSAKCCPNQII
jgi:hypothetical protein